MSSEKLRPFLDFKAFKCLVLPLLYKLKPAAVLFQFLAYLQKTRTDTPPCSLNLVLRTECLMVRRDPVSFKMRLAELFRLDC